MRSRRIIFPCRFALRFATDNEIEQAIGASPGSLGPINLPIPCIADRTQLRW